MKFLTKAACLLLLSSCDLDPVFPEEFYSCAASIPSNEVDDTRSEKFERLLDEMVQAGVPGVMLSVNDHENGFWNGAAGFADLASDIRLQSCHKTRVGSTVKTFTAVSILLLQEDGLLDINEQASNYLTDHQMQGLSNIRKSTILDLLQHASGIFNYIQSAKFQTASLNDLVKIWQPDELLDYAKGKDSNFAPGADVQYSNTNYVLLGLIIEKITGRPFYDFFEERIFTPLGMDFTQFAAKDPVPAGIIRGYVDLYSNLNLTNSTYYSGWDYFTADGGLISNSHDLNIFLTSLFSGGVLSEISLNQMLSFRTPSEQDEDGYKTHFGLGIFQIDTDYGPAYIHSGDAIGYFASMVYFPSQGTTITWAVNGNYGKVDDFTQSKEAMQKIFQSALE